MTQDLVFVVTINDTTGDLRDWEARIRKLLHLAPTDTVRGYPLPIHPELKPVPQSTHWLDS